MVEENTVWNQSTAAVVEREGKILLVRHTYGAGKGMLIIPGGYVKEGETPQAACVREVLEETGIRVAPERIVGVRFNMKDWYVVFSARYISGKAHSDGDENSEVVWLTASELLVADDVPDLTKKIVNTYINGGGLDLTDYYSVENHGTYSLYC